MIPGEGSNAGAADMSEEDALLARKEAREVARSAARAAARIELLRLEERFEDELGGPRGVAFEIVDLSNLEAGFVVVRKGPAVLYRKLRQSKVKLEDVRDFVLPQVVHPEKEAFKEIASRLDAVWTRCMDAAGALHGLDLGGYAGKDSS